jgi:LysM repeat protein
MRTAVLLTVVLLASVGVQAGTRVHTVRPGESASAIARHYYGDFAATDLLLQLNGKSGTLIREGETLSIPYCEVHRVRPGDTWSELARRYAGRVSAYPAIAALNGLPPDRPLRVGARIVMPVVLTHELAGGETLARLAERYYGDVDRAAVLESFNGIEDPRKLSVGQAVQIPLVSLVLREDITAGPPSPRRDTSAPPAATAGPSSPAAVAEQAPAAPQPPPEGASMVGEATPPPPSEPSADPGPRFEAQLAAARSAFRSGDYEGARRSLEELRDRIRSEGSDEDRKELWRQLAFVYVAFDLERETCDAYRSWKALDDAPILDPDLVSPKIRAALSRCG